MTEELDDLGRQRDQTREALARLSVQIGEALDALAAALPPEVRVLPPGGESPRMHVVTDNVIAQPSAS